MRQFVLDDDNLWPDNALTDRQTDRQIDRQTDRRHYRRRSRKAKER